MILAGLGFSGEEPGGGRWRDPRVGSLLDWKREEVDHDSGLPFSSILFIKEQQVSRIHINIVTLLNI